METRKYVQGSWCRQAQVQSLVILAPIFQCISGTHCVGAGDVSVGVVGTL